MKTAVWGIIGGIIGSIIVGSIFFVGAIEFLDTKHNLEQTNDKCAQTFDNVVIPILTGKIQSTEQTSNEWKNFYIEKCATNHSQWEGLSINQDYIRMAGWDTFIQNEQEVLERHQKDQKIADAMADIDSKDFFSNYKINTECELYFTLLKEEHSGRFTSDKMPFEEFKAKYPDQVGILKKYNDRYHAIIHETRDMSAVFKELPEVLDAKFEIMSGELSINPQLRSFFNDLNDGGLSDSVIDQILSNDKTKCGQGFQEVMERMGYKRN